MKIFEVFYNNGEPYDDNYTRSWFYETLDEARDKFDKLTADYHDGYIHCDGMAFVLIYELELGTQARTELFNKDFRYAEPPAEPFDPERDCEAIVGNCDTILGDIDALMWLRNKLCS